jgi:hypothetical protein
MLATLAAGALLALLIAQWAWRWFAPTTSPVAAPGATSADAAAIVAAAPFGRARPGLSAPGAASLPPAGGSAAGDMRLLGTFAGSAGDGYALLRLSDRGAVLVKTGQDITGGVTLEAVHPDAIRIRSATGYRDIELRQSLPSAPPSAAPGPRVASAATRAPRPGCGPPAGFAGPVYRLNAELLTGMGARPESWTAMLAPAGGALAVRDETGLAAMLGMKAGDRVAQANGIALASIDDVLTAVVKPLVASQQVRLTGSRDGQPREWLFLNAGACPQ